MYCRLKMARQNLCFVFADCFFANMASLLLLRARSVTDHPWLLCNQLVLKLNTVPEGRLIHFLFFITHHTTDNFFQRHQKPGALQKKLKEKELREVQFNIIDL